jgi:hypothetical protein
MSAPEVYQQVYGLLNAHFDRQVDESTLHRITLLVLGIITAKSASPAQVAAALNTLGLSGAQVESLERQVRRTENDPELDVSLCFHPFARQRLLFGKARKLLLILDPTTQEDRLVMVSVAVWYRGRALPLAWMVWPANTPLEGAGFWERIAVLLDQVLQLVPAHVPIIWMADRAFGTPAFIDLLIARQWHFVVRVQGQTRCRDRMGQEHSLQDWVRKPGRRIKLQGQVFKKNGWRWLSVVAYWGKTYPAPLCLVSDLPADWSLIQVYRRRYPIEATFRDYKSYGWQWEQGQVTDLEHIERLLIGMALASWIVLFVGTQVAKEILEKSSSGHRHSLPWAGKRSLFRLGLQRLHTWLVSSEKPCLVWELTDWDASNWQNQLRCLYAHAYVFAC